MLKLMSINIANISLLLSNSSRIGGILIQGNLTKYRFVLTTLYIFDENAPDALFTIPSKESEGKLSEGAWTAKGTKNNIVNKKVILLIHLLNNVPW